MHSAKHMLSAMHSGPAGFSTDRKRPNVRLSGPCSAEQIASVYGEHGIDCHDVIEIDGKQYVTHQGLLRVALAQHCIGIHTRPIPEYCDKERNRWTFEAVVYKSRQCKGFVGYGDADPSN